MSSRVRPQNSNLVTLCFLLCLIFQGHGYFTPLLKFRIENAVSVFEPPQEAPSLTDKLSYLLLSQLSDFWIWKGEC